MESEKMAAYLNDVLSRVHWKRAHAPIRRELLDHMQDARQGFLETGSTEGEAETLAVREMGDSAEVGAKLGTAYRPQMNWNVWAPFSLLLIAGVFLQSYIGGQTPNPAYLPLMLVAFFCACFLPPEKLSNLAWPCYGLLLIVMGLIGWQGFQRRMLFVNGAIAYMPYPALLLPAVYALLLYRMRGGGWKALLLLYACLVPPAMLLSEGTGLNMMAMICGVCIALMLYAALSGWLGNGRFFLFALCILPPVLLLLLAALGSPYRFLDLQAAITPEIDPEGAGFIGTTVKQIIASARFLGAADISALPDRAALMLELDSSFFSHDFILVLLSVRLGKAAFFAVVLLLCAFLFGALRTCLKQRSMLGKLTSLAVILTFTVQCGGYILGNLGITLFMSFPLPFLGIGNASLLTNLLLCGLLFSVFRNSALLEDGVPLQKKKQALQETML